jgi:hypothetical protein
MTLAAPAPVWITLPEAVALVSPPIEPDEARRAIAEALADGRLKDRPKAVCDDPLLIKEFQFHPLHPMVAPFSNFAKVWRRWLENGYVDWDTGEVRLPPRPGNYLKTVTPPPFRPELMRSEVLALFGASTNYRPQTAQTNAVVSRAALMEFLMRTADGLLKELDLHQRAIVRFEGRTIPTAVWRAAMTNLPANKKRKRAQTDRTMRKS